MHEDYFIFTLYSYLLVNYFTYNCIYFYFFKNRTLKNFMYLFLKRAEGREKEMERSINVKELIGCLLHAPWQGPHPQARHVPWLGFESFALWDNAQPLEPYESGAHIISYEIHWRSKWVNKWTKNDNIVVLQSNLQFHSMTIFTIL